MAQANADPNAIPNPGSMSGTSPGSQSGTSLAELHAFQQSPPGRTIAAIRDLLVAVEDLDELAKTPALFRLIAAERSYLNLAHLTLGLIVARALRAVP